MHSMHRIRRAFPDAAGITWGIEKWIRSPARSKDPAYVGWKLNGQV